MHKLGPNYALIGPKSLQLLIFENFSVISFSKQKIGNVAKSAQSRLLVHVPTLLSGVVACFCCTSWSRGWWLQGGGLVPEMGEPINVTTSLRPSMDRHLWSLACHGKTLKAEDMFFVVSDQSFSLSSTIFKT